MPHDTMTFYMNVDAGVNAWGDPVARPARPPREAPQPIFAAQPKVEKVKEVFYNRKLIDFNRGPLLRKKTDGEVGIEIECEGVGLATDMLRYWTITLDGSLRAVNGNPPYEYFLRRPLSRNKIREALEYWERKQKNATFSMSNRTSVHVHLNVQQWTMKEIVTFVCLYLLFESSLTEFAGEAREGNLFCQRAKDSEHWIWTLVRAFRTGDFNTVYRDDFRYTACNTASLGHLGSLEFRALRGTTDINLIQGWVSLLLHLKDESKNFDNPADLYEKYSLLGNQDFYQLVFSQRPDLSNLLNSGCQTIDVGMKEGSYFVRDLALSVDEWKEALPVAEVPLEEAEPDGREYLDRGCYVEPAEQPNRVWLINPTAVSVVIEWQGRARTLSRKCKYLYTDQGIYADRYARIRDENDLDLEANFEENEGDDE